MSEAREGQAGPSSSQAGPSSSQAGPSSSQAGPSSSQAGPSSSQAGPSSSQAGPSSSRGGLEDEDDETHFGNGKNNRKERHTSSAPNRTKSNQRWMKLRTTVQLTGAITSTVQKKPPLKREDSFLKRFSTRQIPQLEETIDIGDDGNGDFDRGDDFQASARIQRHRRRQKPPWTVIDPDGEFFYYWMFLVTMCVLYNLWTVIVRQTFLELREGYRRCWFSIDIFSDAVCALDVIVQFRTGYLEQGLMVYDSRKLAGHYFRSKAFFLDIMALFPLELLQLRYGSNPILRFPRFLKIHRVYQYYYIVESRTVYPNLLRVVNLIHILLILAHWFGCFYYLISEAEGFKGEWSYPYRPGPFSTISRKYLGSLYWSTLTLTTIGDLPTPETNAEYIFTIVGYLFGVFIFATIVGQVGNVITNRNANRLEFERLLDGAKTFMRYHKVPGGMKKRVLRWYDYSWSRGRIQGGGDINTALGLLPDKFKTELALHINLSVLKKVTIFQECQPEFLHDLVLKMKPYIFTPGDLICRKGEVARELFIIADGILEVMSETGRVLTTMRAGDFFGEIGILNLDGLNKRTADVRSVGFSELFSLSREDVLNAMTDYPEAHEILQNLGRKRLREAQNINRALKSSAFKQKEKKAMSVLLTPQPSSDMACKIRLGKLRSDVKELRNVLRKGSRTTRSRSDDLDLEPLDSHTDNEPSVSNKNVLLRMPRICSDENPPEADNSPPLTPPKLGAGLPLLQRLKMLKDKQDLEKIEATSKSDSTGASTMGKNREEASPGPGTPLLPLISILKRGGESKSSALFGTATRTAQVLASTVRSQEDAEMGMIDHEADVKSKFRVAESLSGAPPAKQTSSWVTVCDESHERQVKKPIKHTSTSVGLDSWNLLKKAVILPRSNDVARESKEVKFKDSDMDISILDDSNMKTKKEEKNMHIAQVKSAQESKIETQILTPLGITNIAHNTCGTSASNENSSPVSLLSPRSLQSPSNRKQIYQSIDDLSPEYSAQPFVKKLKILNGRQKLAELEDERRTRSFIRGSGGVGEGNGDASPVARCHSDSSVRHQQTSDDASSKVVRPSTLNLATEPIGFSSSPESNETLERKTLKTLLKTFSSASWVDPEKVKRDPALQSNLEQLMRAPTVEGYAARHSKFKTMSNKRPLDTSVPISTDPANAKSSEPKASCSGFSTQEKGRTSERAIARRPTLWLIPKKDSMPIKREESFLRADSPFVAHKEFSTIPLEILPPLPEAVEEPGSSTDSHSSSEIFTDVGHLMEHHVEGFLNDCTSDLFVEMLRRDQKISCLEKRIAELESLAISEVTAEESTSECQNELTERAEEPETEEPETEEPETEEPEPISQRNTNEQHIVDLSGIDNSDSGSEDDASDANTVFPCHWEDHMLAQQLCDREEAASERRTVSLDSGRRSYLTKKTRKGSLKTELLSHDEPTSSGSQQWLDRKRSASISHIHKPFTSRLRKGYWLMKKSAPPSPEIVSSLTLPRQWELRSTSSSTSSSSSSSSSSSTFEPK